jgi:hypothetical protein
MGIISLVDIFFALIGTVLTLVSLHGKTRDEKISPPCTFGELFATFIALACAAVGPNILVVGLTPGMPEMHSLARLVLVPSLIILIAIYLLAKKKRWARLTNRIWTGIWTGAIATGTLDVVRLTGFYLGFMPGNMPRMFGVLILDIMATGPTPYSDIIGYLYHYWVGACFGLTLTLICGKVRWWAGLIWGLIIEIGMMTTPPMVIAMDTGYFGLKFGPGLLVVSLIAHIVYGASLGLLAEKYTRHKGTVFSMIVLCLKTKIIKGGDKNEMEKMAF